MVDPNVESGGIFFSQFLDDYFAECDELLTSVRVQLLTMEESLDRPVDPAVLDELFRAFHTLKGISAMVGLGEAETIAHDLESSLRLLREANEHLTEDRLNSLVEATESLVRVVEDFRSATVAESVEQEVGRPSNLHEDATSSQTIGVNTTLEPMMRTWMFSFSPTAEGVANGFNVNRVRAALQELGEVRKATPVVRSDGEIVFEFAVSTSKGESAFAALVGGGVTFRPVETATLVIPAAAKRAVEARQSSPKSASSLVRVDLERLDELMLSIGEVGTSRARLEEQIKRLRSALPPAEWRTLQEIEMTMGRQVRVLREGVMRVRMVPLGEIFERMRFVVRDLARENRKKVELQLAGENTEIDKLLVQRMMDPLLHLVRNAVSHGLESSEERERLGKLPAGRIILRGATEGDSVLIEVEDDGRGIDVAKVETLARQRGVIRPSAQIHESELFDILAAPSFSTREHTDRESGRGVGLDVVKRIVEELHGSIRLTTQSQRGTRFSIRLPLTLALADAFLANSGGQTFAIPQTAVREIIEIDPAFIKGIESNEVISYRNTVLRLIRLARIFGLPEQGQRLYAMVVGKEPNVAGLVVDRILGHREIVVRAANDPLLRVPAVAGATEIGDGRLILILDIRELLNKHQRTSVGEAVPA